MTAQPIHYLRTRQHYDNAPVGTRVAAQGFPDGWFWEKVTRHAWRWADGLFLHNIDLGGGKRRILRWGLPA